MYISHLYLKNWRNFTEVDVDLQSRQFIVGPNASGKSNMLDVFRFLRDIAKQERGGLQTAIENRGGLSKIRCLSARRDTEIVICVAISDSDDGNDPLWTYEIGIKQNPRGHRRAYLSKEIVRSRGNPKPILNRPDKEDENDEKRLGETHLQQMNNNLKFREIRDYFEKINYIHMVPQLLRYATKIQGNILEDDPFGQGFLQNMVDAQRVNRESRLITINKVMKGVVPDLEEIKLVQDPMSVPHIMARYSHWRPNAGWQGEDQFSDGTLRLIALIWFLLDGDSLLLLEEPELSLHVGIVEMLPGMLYQARREQQKRKHQRTPRQILISTHSRELLLDEGIGAEEILMLSPTPSKGTTVKVASDVGDVMGLLSVGIPAGDVVLSRTKSGEQYKLNLF